MMPVVGLGAVLAVWLHVPALQQPAAVLELPGPRGRVGRVFVSPDGSRVAASASIETLAKDGGRTVNRVTGPEVFLWDARTGKVVKTVPHPDVFGGRTVALGFVDNGKALLVGELRSAADHRHRAVDAATGEEVKAPPFPDARGAAYQSADGAVVLAVHSPEFRKLQLRVWRRPFEGPPAVHDLAGSDLGGVGLSADGKVGMTAVREKGSQAASITVWDVPANKVARVIPTDSRGFSPAAALSPDGAAVVGRTDGRLTVWETATGKPAGRPLAVNLWGASFAGDGRTLVGVTAGRGIAVVDVATGRVRQVVASPLENPSVTAFPGGKRLVVVGGPANDERHVRVIDLPDPPQGGRAGR